MAIGFIKRNKEINKVVLIPLERLQKSRGQTRSHFDKQSIKEVAQSIQQNGLLQPISVRRQLDGNYELIAGERRSLAYRQLGYSEIPAIIEDYSDEQSIVLTLIENLQRKNLNYFEEAEGIARLMESLGLSQQQVSERLGKAQSTIANKMRLLAYSPAIRERMLEAGFTERHARALLKLPDDDAINTAIDIVEKDGLTVEQTEQLALSILKKPAKQGARVFILKDMRVFLNSIQKAVGTMNQAGIPVNTTKTENEDYVELHIRIPKSAVYKTKPACP
jgi:ParB family chromosome partitioning protein